MALTSIGDRKTPSRPIEITFDPETGLPSDSQNLLLIGRAASSMPASAAYVAKVVNNVADDQLAVEELSDVYGETSEIVKMVQAAILANTLRGAATFPSITIMPLQSSDLDFGASSEGLVNARNTRAEFIVSPFDGTDNELRDELRDHVTLVSGANRPDNNQFGSFGVVMNNNEQDPSALPAFDSQGIIGLWLRDSGSPDKSLGEQAAACAAVMAANGIPFNPLNNTVIGGLDAPEDRDDWISVGAGLESESCLDQGWTPLRVKPNGDVSFVRTVTGRLTNDAGAEVTAYYDVQDFQVLYYWRRTIWTRQNQPDFTNVKASLQKAIDLRGEMVRLAQLFQDQGMFQAVDQLAKQFKVERALTDRHRFDVLTPVNVIPGLHVIATRIAAGTQFDSFSI